MKSPNILAGITAVLLLLVAACSQSSARPSSSQPPQGFDTSTPVVIFTDEGFVPKRLDVDQGQLVRFRNQSDKRMWIASNIHPTHQIYPELDAKEPIPPGGDWFFTFAEVGFWRYHNHMASEKAGIVVVTGATARAIKPLVIETRSIDFKEPESLSTGDYVNLFENDKMLQRWVEDYGPAATVEALYDAQSFMEVDCHQRAHDLGRYAYEVYGAYAFALASHECQAGSLHGSTEALFRDRGTGNLKADVAALCSNTPNSFFHHQCVHGVGHGLLAWTSYELYDTLPLCDQLESNFDRESCYSGVFMENIVGGFAGTMGHVTEYLSDDPHYPCNALDEKYVGPCYYYQSSRMIALFDRDFQKLADACAEAPPSAHRNCFLSMGRDVGQETRGNPAASIEICGYIKDPANHASCTEGSVQDRFWDLGGADEAMSLCHLVEEETSKSGCYNMIISRAANLFTDTDAFQAYCARVEERYVSWCEGKTALGVD